MPLETSNPMLWLAWAAFGSFLGWLLWKRYRPEVLRMPVLPREAPKLPPAWLYCEEGTALDRRARWFGLRPGGRTLAGRRPRASTEETHYLYLTADDLQEDHVLIASNPETGRYEVEALGAGLVMHNNEPLPPGERAELADGDTLDLGRLSRFRFTLTGPEEE